MGGAGWLAERGRRARARARAWHTTSAAEGQLGCIPARRMNFGAFQSARPPISLQLAFDRDEQDAMARPPARPPVRPQGARLCAQLYFLGAVYYQIKMEIKDVYTRTRTRNDRHSTGAPAFILHVRTGPPAAFRPHASQSPPKLAALD